MRQKYGVRAAKLLGVGVWTIALWMMQARLCMPRVPTPKPTRAIEFHVMREFFRVSNLELLAVWRSPVWSANTKPPHSPPHFETSRYRPAYAASPYESARVGSSCGSRPQATRESPPLGTLRSCQNR